MLGGNLDIIATAAGWVLPDLHGAILLLEAVDMHFGQIDRILTRLRKARHLFGVAGVAVGQFTRCASNHDSAVVDLLRDHLERLGVPILGGLPLGHGSNPLSVLHGATAMLDATSGILAI